MSAQLKEREEYTGYTFEDKRGAFAQYLVHGNICAVSRNTGIPKTTLHDWSHSDWWLAEAERVRTEQSAELDIKLTRLIDLAAAAILERLEHGDHKLTKDGSLVRVPVSAKDAAVTMAIVFDKRQIARSLPTSITANSGQLDSLAANLLKLKQEPGKQPATHKPKSIA